MSVLRSRLALRVGLLLTAVFGSLTARAQEVAGGSDPQELNKRLGRGVNIIGYDPLWRSRDKARFQEKHFRLIAEVGFSHVRANLHPWRDRKIDAQNRLADDWLEVVDWVVKQAMQNKLLVVLDLHEFQAMGRDAEGNRGAVPGHLEAVGSAIPPGIRQGPLRDPERAQQKVDAGVVEPVPAGSPGCHPRLEPQSCRGHRPRLLEPRGAPGQAAASCRGSAPDRHGALLQAHVVHAPRRVLDGPEGQGRRPVEGDGQERAAIERDFDKVQAWAKQHQRPVYLREFGAYDKGEMASRVRYTTFVAREAERRGWSWSYWQFNGDFIVFDMKTQQWVEPILRALIPLAK